MRSGASAAKTVGLPSRVAEILSATLLIAAFLLIQVLIGGTRLVFSMPAYVLLALMGLLALFSLRRIKPNPDKLCLATAAIFFAYILGRAFLSPVGYMARADIYSVLGGLLVYFFVACVLTGPKPRMIVVILLIAAGIVHVGIGAIQFTEGHNFMLVPFLLRPDYGYRASGFYVCPDHLAGLLEVLGVFGLSIVCWSRWPIWAKLLVAYGTAVSYVGLALTGSRGGYLSTIASLAVFALLSLTVLARASPKLFWRIGAPFAIAAIVIWIAVSFSMRQSFYLTERTVSILGDNLSDSSAAVRMAFWQAAARQWKVQPIWGTGSGTYLYYARLFRTDELPGDPTYAHNDYLNLLAEYGLVGAAGFLIFLGFHLRRGWKNFERLGPKRVASSVSPSFLSNGLALSIGALAAVAAYLVHSIFDFNLHIPANVLLMAFVFGVLANGGTQRAGEGHRPTATVVLWRLTLPVIGVIVLIQCVRLLPAEYFAERARTIVWDQKKADAALQYALRGIETEHKNPYLYHYLSAAQIQKARLTSDAEERKSLNLAAMGQLEKAYALAPRDKTFVLALALTCDDVGSAAEADRMYDEAMATDPRSRPLRELYEAHVHKRRKTSPIESSREPSAGPSGTPRL